MKVGNLYEVHHKWLLPHSTSDFWSSCGSVLYLGEDTIHRDDGVTITNHAVLVDGQRRILDKSFLRFLEPIDESRRHDKNH